MRNLIYNIIMRIRVSYTVVWYMFSIYFHPTETVLSKSAVVGIASPAASFHASPPHTSCSVRAVAVIYYYYYYYSCVRPRLPVQIPRYLRRGRAGNIIYFFSGVTSIPIIYVLLLCMRYYYVFITRRVYLIIIVT